MDAPADRSTRTAGPQIRPAVREAGGGRRRRPSGEPPPLPHHLQTSGIRWLVAMLVLVALTIVVFAGGLRGIAVDVAVADAAVVGWLGGIDLPGFRGLMRGLAALSSWWVLNLVAYGLILVLLVLRRFRHMIIWLVVANLLSVIGPGILGPVTQRPRPFGVEIREGWGGWAMPSTHVLYFAAGLVAILYTLVPEGRWRNTGKWVVTALVALNALGRMALGADGPADVLVGAAIGVTIPLLAFRWFAPNEVFPITYRRGSAAHLDVGGARGAAIRRGLEDQLGLVATEVKPFGLSGSAGSTPLRITVAGDPPVQLFGKLYARSHMRSDRWYKLGGELLYGRLEDEKPFNTVRRLVQQEDYALSLMQRAGLPSPTPLRLRRAHPRTGIPAGHRVLRRRHRAGRGRGRRADHRRRSTDHPPAVGRRPGPPRRDGGQADRRLRGRRGGRAGLGPAGGPALPAGHPPGTGLPGGPLRRFPGRLRHLPDQGGPLQPGRSHGRGPEHPRLRDPRAAQPGPRPALRRTAPPLTTRRPHPCGWGRRGVACYWASIGRTLAAWGPLGPWATSNSTA
jgi:hypothetical protein